MKIKAILCLIAGVFLLANIASAQTLPYGWEPWITELGTIQVSINSPEDSPDSVRIWTNLTGGEIRITELHMASSDTAYTCYLHETDYDGSNMQVIDTLRAISASEYRCKITSGFDHSVIEYEHKIWFLSSDTTAANIQVGIKYEN